MRSDVLFHILIRRVEVFELDIPKNIVFEISEFCDSPGTGLVQMHDYMQYTKERGLDRNMETFSDFLIHVGSIPGTDEFHKYFGDKWDEQKTPDGNKVDMLGYWRSVN